MKVIKACCFSEVAKSRSFTVSACTDKLNADISFGESNFQLDFSESQSLMMSCVCCSPMSLLFSRK